jgi:hypothetical protein
LPLREPGIVLPSFLRIEPKDTAVKPHPQPLGRLIYWERQRFRRLEHIDNGSVRPPASSSAEALLFGEDRTEAGLRPPCVPRQIDDAAGQGEQQDERGAHE